MPSSLLIDTFEIGVAQKPPAARKANFPYRPRRFLVVLFSRSERGHCFDSRRQRGEHADNSIRATRSRDTIFAK